MTLELTTSVQYLRGVGPRRAQAFARLGVRTIEDLLYHTPHRYVDATSVTPIAKVAVGGEGTIVGRVVSKGVLPTRRRLRVFRAILRDETRLIECAWPGQAFLDRTIVPGQLLLVTGPVKYFHGRQVVPREQIVLEEPAGTTETTGATGGEDAGITSGLVIPVYPATEGLSHRHVRRIIQDKVNASVDEFNKTIKYYSILSLILSIILFGISFLFFLPTANEENIFIISVFSFQYLFIISLLICALIFKKNKLRFLTSAAFLLIITFVPYILSLFSYRSGDHGPVMALVFISLVFR